MDKRRSGDAAELLATAYLLEQGYEVFINASATGPVDLICMSTTGEIRKFDIKRANQHPSGIIYVNKQLSDKAAFDSLGVEYMFVFISTDFTSVISTDEAEFYQKLKAAGHKCRDLTKKVVSMREYEIKRPDGDLSIALGVKELASFTGFTNSQLTSLLAGKVVNGYEVVSRRQVTVTLDYAKPEPI